jgi:hypothetical protein
MEQNLKQMGVEVEAGAKAVEVSRQRRKQKTQLQ